jgi:hypothetical protein
MSLAIVLWVTSLIKERLISRENWWDWSSIADRRWGGGPWFNVTLICLLLTDRRCTLEILAIDFLPLLMLGKEPNEGQQEDREDDEDQEKTKEVIELRENICRQSIMSKEGEETRPNLLSWAERWRTRQRFGIERIRCQHRYKDARRGLSRDQERQRQRETQRERDRGRERQGQRQTERIAHL